MYWLACILFKNQISENLLSSANNQTYKMMIDHIRLSRD